MNPIMQLQFETWAKWHPRRDLLPLTIVDGRYEYPVTEIAYQAWRASLDAMVQMVALLNEDEA